jgi:transcriptional regulator with XRE-family HTH domain
MDTGKVGSYIAICRKRKAMTQQGLADALGITNKAISKWETGQGMPDISILPALSEILGITVDELLKGEDKLSEVEASPVINIAPSENGKDTVESSKNQNEVTRYLVEKSVIKFKTRATLSIFLSLIGCITAFFVSLDETPIFGIAIGLWWIAISAGIFYSYYIIMKNEINSFNRTAVNHMDSKEIGRPFLKIAVCVWCLLPIFILFSMVY